MAMRLTTNNYAVTATPVSNLRSKDVDTVVFTARRDGDEDKTWSVPVGLLASVFSYRFSPLTAAQMIVALRRGKQIVLSRSCCATELTELGYRNKPRGLGDG